MQGTGDHGDGTGTDQFGRVPGRAAGHQCNESAQGAEEGDEVARVADQARRAMAVIQPDFWR